MNKKCDKDDKSCGSNCEQTRAQVGRIMLAFGVVIIGLAWYILSSGILEKALS